MKARAALLGLIIGFSAPSLPAAEQTKDALPSAKEILLRYQKEIGGAEAFRKHKSEHLVGSVEMPAQKLTGTMDVYMMRPDKILTKSSIAGLGEMTRGFNGEVGWLITAVTGPMLIEGAERQELRSEADFDHMLHDPADFKVMETVGQEKFDNEDCYKLKLVHKTGFASTEFFSVKTGLQRGIISTATTFVGQIQATTILSEYKSFGDLTLPSKMVQTTSGIETVMTTKEIEFDKVDPKVFETPAQIQTLIEARLKGSAVPEGKTDKANKSDKASEKPAKSDKSAPAPATKRKRANDSLREI